MDKSFVSVEQNICLVCGKPYDTGALLFDRRLRQKFDRTTATGYGLCLEHQQKFDEGYVALVAADGARSTRLPNGNVAPGGAYRTGEVVHLRFDVFDKIMNVPGMNLKGERFPMMFCDPEVIEKLKTMAGDKADDKV